MSKLSEDIASVYLKEDLRKVLQKIRDKKELEEDLSGRALQSRIMDIAKANKIANPNRIYAGKSLNVDDSKYTIKRGDNLTKIARSFPGAGKTPAPRSAAPKPVAAKPAAPAPKPVAAKPAAPAPKPVAAKPAAPKVAPAAAPTPAPTSAARPGLSTGKQTLPSVNVGKSKASPTPSWKDQGAVERQRMSSEKPSTAPEPDIPKVSTGDSGVSVTRGKSDFTRRYGNRQYELPAPMRDKTGKTGGMSSTLDYLASRDAITGIRSRFSDKSVRPDTFNYPGQVGGQSRALGPPTQSNAAPPVSAPTPEPKAPESEVPKPSSVTNPDGSGARIMNRPVPTTPVRPDEPGRASYLKGAEDLANAMKGKNPNDLVPKAAKIGREPVNESVVTVGSNKYRVI